jgi:hypothetical protein
VRLPVLLLGARHRAALLDAATQRGTASMLFAEAA